jgi:hypothetical protein
MGPTALLSIVLGALICLQALKVLLLREVPYGGLRGVAYCWLSQREEFVILVKGIAGSSLLSRVFVVVKVFGGARV